MFSMYLERADELVQHLVDRIHRGYVTAGASRRDSGLVSLRDLVAQPPPWIERYVDLVKLMRANPSVASTLLQTAELACFDALCGDHAYEAKAFDHLFTREHEYLLVAAAACPVKVRFLDQDPLHAQGETQEDMEVGVAIPPAVEHWGHVGCKMLAKCA